MIKARHPSEPDLLASCASSCPAVVKRASSQAVGRTSYLQASVSVFPSRFLRVTDLVTDLVTDKKKKKKASSSVGSSTSFWSFEAKFAVAA